MLSHSIMSDSLQPHVLYPTRLLCSWGFSRQEYWRGLPCPHPGDLPNPGVKLRSPELKVDSVPSEPPGKALSGLCVCSVTQSCQILCDPMDYGLPASSVHGIFPGKNTGVSCHSLLHGIFLNQEGIPCLLHWKADSLTLSHQGSLRIRIS